MKRTFLWSVVALMFMTSCQDEFIKNDNKTMDRIGYKVDTYTISAPLQVRASRSSGTTDVGIEKLEQTLGGKPLYLHTVTDMVVPMDIKAEKKKDTKKAQSRGVIKATGDVDKIAVTGIVWNGDTWADDDAKKLYMDNVVAESSQSFLTNYYWPAAEDHIRFFAYHPVLSNATDDVNKDVKIITGDDTNTNGNGAKGLQTLAWTVPADVTKQHDLLVASSEEPGNKKAEAPLFFGHALTAVQFAIAGDITGLKVKSITISGVKNAGTYIYEYSGDNEKTTDIGEWTNLSGNQSFTIDYGDTPVDIDEKRKDNTDSDDVIINEGENVFMMMPQELVETALVTINVIDTENSNKEVPITGKIGGLNANNVQRVWQKGTLVKYRISLTSTSEEWKFELVDSNGDPREGANIDGSFTDGPYNWYGGFGTYTIRSYKQVTDIVGRVTYIPVKWVVDKMTGVDHVTGKSGSGVSDPAGAEGPFQYGVLPGTLTTTSLDGKSSGTHESLMTRIARGTIEEPHDLSLYDNINGGWNEPVLNATGRNTANCYIVRAPGYYMFPVVYGNAITDNVDNTAAYRKNIADKDVPITATRYEMTNSVNNSVGDVTLTASVLGAFKDHANAQNSNEGNPIDGPWIADQAEKYSGVSYEIDSVKIVWQDAPCLVTDVKKIKRTVDGIERDFVSFRVHPEAICEGNAVIAVKSKDRKDNPLSAGKTEAITMWSWHIWVTDQNLAGAKTLTNRRVLGNYAVGDTDASKWEREESTFGLLPSYIGLCRGEVFNYAATPGTLTFNQLADDGTTVKKTLTITFTRSASETIKTRNNSTVYQWGRKDPMLPYYRNDNGDIVNKIYYDHERNQYNKTGITKNQYSGKKYLSLSIQEPEIFFTTPDEVVGYVNTRNWCKKNYVNLWNANVETLPMFSYTSDVNAQAYHAEYSKTVEVPVVKTVYDPCPPGWEMPRIDTFTGVTLYGTTDTGYYLLPGGEDPTTRKDLVSFSTEVNIGWHDYYKESNYNKLYEMAFFRRPMPSAGERVGSSESVNDNINLFWTLGLGHREADGFGSKYAEYGAALTSGVSCIQWLAEKGASATTFDYEGVRLCYIHGASSDMPLNTYLGTVRPMSGSYTDKSFGIIPVRTGMNPHGTKILPAGTPSPYVKDVYPSVLSESEETGTSVGWDTEINPWKDRDDKIEIGGEVE